MSGGHFDYQQSKLLLIAQGIEYIIEENNIDAYSYPDDIIQKFKETVKMLEETAERVQRIDWLVSGDDGIESFRERWAKNIDSRHK